MAPSCCGDSSSMALEIPPGVSSGFTRFRSFLEIGTRVLVPEQSGCLRRVVALEGKMRLVGATVITDTTDTGRRGRGGLCQPYPQHPSFPRFPHLTFSVGTWLARATISFDSSSARGGRASVL